MPALELMLIQCPYCWETQEIAIDPSVSEQEYVEDCQVCCRPIVLSITIDVDLTPHVDVRAEND
ncbi:CPXCG motif-containing cysteine-rich protein [Marinobacter salinisoli]|uniref:CPXCG motif-containing cysteine-rich protein n=1 Tax=Marinobacter salinisoli TaxID=2769486 RepID=A0ABX7MW14_9GAMM|nr:CPXCG motif-containing cysteine-rich protein [Marinobacter salinisoli]QSP96338.1 CPXCG motif-containing cysteine-rich protein [Marinobacter salinisoli]